MQAGTKNERQDQSLIRSSVESTAPHPYLPPRKNVKRCLVEDAIKFVITEKKNTVRMQRSAVAIFESQAYEVVEDLSLKTGSKTVKDQGED